MHISDKAKARFPGIKLAAYQINGMRKKGDWLLRELMRDMEPELARGVELDNYQGFKCRSKLFRIASGELNENPLAACVELIGYGDGVVASAYDWDKIAEEPYLDVADEDTVAKFESDSSYLTKGSLIFRDQEKLLSIVPCYDLASPSKKTKNILVVVFGSSATPRGQVIGAVEDISRTIRGSFGGKVTSMVYLD